MIKNVLISGGSGLVGNALTRFLLNKGYKVAILSRSVKSEGDLSFKWDVDAQTIDKEAVEFADLIIHLAGENVSSKRWSPKQKKKIIDSRVKSTKLLYKAIEKADKKPELFISASAVGYYGFEDQDIAAKEDDKPGRDFLAETVKLWEEEVMKIENLGLETIRLRLGVVIAKEGGFLNAVKIPVKFGIGSAVGSGEQFIPWIEMEDLVRMIYYVMKMENPESVYNAVAPESVSNKDLMRTLAKKMRKPFFFPTVPAFMIRLLFGEMGDIVLKGKRVSSDKIEKEGFKFKHHTFSDAIKDYDL